MLVGDGLLVFREIDRRFPGVLYFGGGRVYFGSSRSTWRKAKLGKATTGVACLLCSYSLLTLENFRRHTFIELDGVGVAVAKV